MSLIVNAYSRSESQLEFAPPVEHADELAGFEDCRQTLWGHPFVVSLGLSLLPLLAHDDLYCEGVARLEAEVELLLTRLVSVSAATGFDGDFITRRCQNILGAARRARELSGGVFIG